MIARRRRETFSQPPCTIHPEQLGRNDEEQEEEEEEEEGEAASDYEELSSRTTPNLARLYRSN